MKFYHLVLSLCLPRGYMCFMYLFVRLQLSSVICYIFVSYLRFVIICVLWRAWGYPSLSGSSREKNIPYEKILLKGPPRA
jgi:hypothetical protein